MTNNTLDTPDLIIVCQNEEKVKAKKFLFSLFSPIMREILGCLESSEVVVIMPDIKKVAMEKVVQVLKMGWDEQIIFDQEVRMLFSDLNIELGELEIHEKSKSETKLMNILEGESIGRQYRELVTNMDVKCPKCPKQYTGTPKRVKDVLRVHLGTAHLHKEMESELEQERKFVTVRRYILEI